MSKRKTKIQSERIEPKVTKERHEIKSPKLNCHKKSVFTKDSIKYIYKNYHDFSSSTVDTVFDGIMYPQQEISELRKKSKQLETECVRNRSVKDNLREKLTKDAYNYEYAQYMRPLIDASIESCHCEPVYPDLYFENMYPPPPYVPEYYSYCPETQYYPHIPSYPRKSQDKTNLKKRPKKKRSPAYLTDTSTEVIQKQKMKSPSKTKKSVTSCGNQTEFERRASNTGTQTDITKGKLENILSYCSLRTGQSESLWALFGHYSKYIFLASLSFNLLRLYRKM